MSESEAAEGLEADGIRLLKDYERDSPPKLQPRAERPNPHHGVTVLDEREVEERLSRPRPPDGAVGGAVRVVASKEGDRLRRLRNITAEDCAEARLENNKLVSARLEEGSVDRVDRVLGVLGGADPSADYELLDHVIREQEGVDSQLLASVSVVNAQEQRAQRQEVVERRREARVPLYEARQRAHERRAGEGSLAASRVRRTLGRRHP